MKINTKFGMLIAVAVLCSLPTAAQESRFSREGENWVQVVTGSLPATRSLKVDNEIGSIRINGGAQRTIQYTVTKRISGASEESSRRQFEAFRIIGNTRGDTTILEGRAEGGRYKRFSVEFVISVPRDLSGLKAETNAGSVWVNNIAGAASVETSAGSINLNDVGGTIAANTAGGSIEVSNAGGNVALDSAGGSITLRNVKGRVAANTAGGSILVDTTEQGVVAETAGGSINVNKCGGALKASTAGGSVEVGDVNGPATLDTAGGSIRLKQATGQVKANTGGGAIHLYRLMRGVNAETGAGSITAEFVAKPGQFTDSALATNVGDVIVYLPPDLGVTVKAVIESALGHRIRSDFPELKIASEGGDFGPKEVYATGNINGGGPLLKIRTTLGNIELRKGSK